tara:strand:- start:261 stop:488 length:228 start_codon:yes stop_codon:yes gene_type:complete
MPRKFKKHYLMPTSFDPKDHWMVGIEWPVKGSKGNEYNVLLTDKGFECECVGFSFHGKCKHSKAVVEQVEGAMEL